MSQNTAPEYHFGARWPRAREWWQTLDRVPIGGKKAIFQISPQEKENLALIPLDADLLTDAFAH
jgi:hypothetical protein